MKKVKIICDSTLDMTTELYAKYDFDMIPLHVCFGEEDYLDGVSINISQLYKMVEEHKQLPHTAAISIGEFEEKFKKYIDMDMDIVYYGIGSSFSSSFQNAVIASQSFPEGRIHIVDTRSLCVGSALIAIRGSQLRDAGKSASEIAEETAKLAEKVVLIFAVDTFDYLYKGGRCSGAAKVVGTLLHIHPCLIIEDGKLIVFKKPRGPMKVAIKELLKKVDEDSKNLDKSLIFVANSKIDKTLLDYLLSGIEEHFDKDKIISIETGCVIGSHCGPGATGFGYLKK